MLSTNTWTTVGRGRMTIPDLRRFKDYYEKQEFIGRGAFGEALTVKRHSDGAIFIMKKEKILSIEKREEKKKRKDEVNALKKCTHNNIVCYIDDFIDEKYSRIIMEYCEEGDLGVFIRNQQGNLLSTSAVLNWAGDLASGMAYLKVKRIVHRDLKPDNIFIASGQLKIGDFGLARCFDRSSEMASTQCGTPAYMAPELLEDKPVYNHTADLWSLGCVLYEMCTLERAFDGGRRSIIERILRAEYGPTHSTALRVHRVILTEIVPRLLKINHNMRMGADKIHSRLHLRHRHAQLPGQSTPVTVIASTSSQPTVQPQRTSSSFRNNWDLQRGIPELEDWEKDYSPPHMPELEDWERDYSPPKMPELEDWERDYWDNKHNGLQEF